MKLYTIFKFISQLLSQNNKIYANYTGGPPLEFFCVGPSEIAKLWSPKMFISSIFSINMRIELFKVSIDFCMSAIGFGPSKG